MRTIGIICLAACVLSIFWIALGAFYTPVGESNEYRFDGVHAAEGTTLTVKDGKLELVGGMGFSVDQPLRRIIDHTLWGMCFLTSLISGIGLLWMHKRPKQD